MMKKSLDILKKICYLLILLIIILNLINITLKGYTKYINNKGTYKGGIYVPPYIINKQAYIKIYKYSNDAYIAESICDTKYPYQLAAIAKVESNYKPLVRGDSGSSFGLFQIQKKHWGKVPERVPDQVAKAEGIYTSLLQKHKSFDLATTRWNGKGKKAKIYTAQVMQIKREIESQGV